MTSRAVIATVVSLGAATGVAQAATAPPPSAAFVPVAGAQSLLQPAHYRCWVKRCGPYRCVWINRCRRPYWW